jgi:hypothetical protein
MSFEFEDFLNDEKSGRGDLDELLADFKNAESLYELRDALQALEDAGHVNLESVGIDATDLPNFGGLTPEDTDGVWSWDEDSVLEGYQAPWQIISREQLAERDWRG